MADASVLTGAAPLSAVVFLVAVSAMVTDLDHQTVWSSSQMQQQRQRREQDEVKLPGIPIDHAETRQDTL
jgi:hypothetical protein